MLFDLTSLDPQELVILMVAIGGLIPVVMYHRKLSSWLLIPYGFLMIGAITTNIENLLWPDLFNFIEHGIGNLGAGIGFAILAYVHRQRIQDTVGAEKAPSEG